MIGTDFEVRVWETLLGIPMGKCSTYSDIANKIGKPKAARAVGAAVGKNPISFVVPCHRVLGRSGDITGYHWGLTRKRAMLGWEAGQVAGCPLIRPSKADATPERQLLPEKRRVAEAAAGPHRVVRHDADALPAGRA